MSVPSSPAVFALCYVRGSWADAWVEAPLLECLTVGDQAAPAHATASFQYEYGVGMLPAIGSRPADVVQTVIPKPDLQGKYVKVVTAGWSWFGILMESEDQRFGDIQSGGIGYPSGRVTYTAYGLSLLLDYTPVREAIVDDSGTKVGRALPVNTNFVNGHWAGNKAQAGLWFAHSEIEAVEEWSGAAFLNYLTTNFAITNRTGSSAIPVQFVGATGALGYQLPSYDYDGSTLWQILNELVNRRRGVAFNVVIDESTNPHTLQINIFSFVPVALSIPSGLTIPANANQASLNLAAAANVTQEQVTASAFSVYDQVRVIGEFRGSVFTVSPADAMVKSWETADETTYNTAASGDTDFASLDDEEKYRRNQEYRSADLIEKVFSWWDVKHDWNQEIGGKKVFPFVNPNGTVHATFAVDAYQPGLKVFDYVPMNPGLDYSGDPDEVTAEFNAAGGQNWLPPMVWFDKILAEHLDADADNTDSVEEPRTWSVGIKNRQDWPGMIFEVTGGKQHFIAEDLYTSNGTYEDIQTADRAINHDNWLATIYVQCQDRVVVKYPDDSVTPSPEPDVWRVFDLIMPGAHFDLLIEGTTVGFETGTGTKQAITADGGVLRDDREVMADQARLVWEYVKQPRKLLSVSLEAVNTVIPVGTLYTQIGGGTANAQTVNSVVTSTEYDLKTGGVSFQTEGAELDIVERSI